jgi:hypothetical protein
VIPELLDGPLDSFALKADFAKWKEILVKEYHFKTMEKALDDLKKKFFMPIQSSLF